MEVFRIRGFHPLWPGIPACSSILQLLRTANRRCLVVPHNSHIASAYPFPESHDTSEDDPYLRSRNVRLGFSHFARHYFGNLY